MNKFKAYYVFQSKEELTVLMDSLKYVQDEEELKLYPYTNFKELGNPTLEEAEYNDEGETIKEAVKDDTVYLVNVLWRGIEVNEDNGKGIHPIGWKDFSVVPSTPDFEMWGVEVLKYNMEI